MNNSKDISQKRTVNRRSDNQKGKNLIMQISIFDNDEVKEIIEIKHFFNDWHEVTRERAQKFVAYIIPHMIALPAAEKIKFIESKWLRGITVQELLKDNLETIFNKKEINTINKN